MKLQPSASYSFILRTETSNTPGLLGRVATAIGQEGGDIGAIDIVRAGGGKMVRDVTVAARDEAHAEEIVECVRSLDGVTVLHVTDRTFLLHLGGKIEVNGRVPVKGRDDLSMVYTPGVARISLAIRDDPLKQWTLTVKRHTVAVVSDGSAVLGLGNIGPAAAQPVMEGKCMIFKAFADLDAFPICLATQDADEIVAAVRYLAPVFGGINLEDIAAPKCFLVEERLRSELDIPVMHDDQHGTAVVVLAALKNALKLVGKPIELARIVVSGVGAAGVATARIMVAAGARHVITVDRAGALYAGRIENMNPYKERLATETNPDRLQGSLSDVLRGADVFIGLSGPGVVTSDDIESMAEEPIVFALANPIPEVQPEELAGIARVIATGRSDYPNQINNSLAFPGIFRGALEVQATDIDESMKLAAAETIAGLVGSDELTEEYIIPSMFDRRVAEAVTAATREAAWSSGVARKPRPAQ
ncbi:MAG TPA: malic enzyme-like NAD(P)-binding protein [Chloroflexota bacterium]|nr:malic enzyme-like NAD(P)-binding protein [Chloroflexota bacterium]